MATLFSDELTRVRAGRKLSPSEQGGKLRVLKWDFASLPAGNIGDVLVCGIIHANERALLGREFHSAQGGTATGAYSTFAIGADGLSLGAIITAGKYLAAVTFVAAGQNFFASTLAENALTVETADVFLCCVNAASAFATAGRIAGELLLVGD